MKSQVLESFLPLCAFTFWLHFIYPKQKAHTISSFLNNLFWPVLLCGLLTALSAVKRTSLFAVCNTLCVKCTADYVVTYARQVTDSSSADKHNAVFLKVMSDAGDVASSLKTVCKTNTGDFTKSRVRFLRRRRSYLRANASLLRRSLIGVALFDGVVTFLKHGRL